MKKRGIFIFIIVLFVIILVVKLQSSPIKDNPNKISTIRISKSNLPTEPVKKPIEAEAEQGQTEPNIEKIAEDIKTIKRDEAVFLLLRKAAYYLPSKLIEIKDPFCDLSEILAKNKRQLQDNSVVDLIKIDRILVEYGIDATSEQHPLFIEPAFGNTWEDLKAVELLSGAKTQSELLALNNNHWVIKYYKALSLGGLIIGLKENNLINLQKSLDLLNEMEAQDADNSSYKYFSVAIKKQMGISFNSDLQEFISKPDFYTPDSFAEKVIFRQGYQSIIHNLAAIGLYSSFPIPDYVKTSNIIKEITNALNPQIKKALADKYQNLLILSEQINDNSFAMIYSVAKSGLNKIKVPEAKNIKPYVDIRKYPYDLNELVLLTENFYKGDCNSKRFQELFDLELRYGRYK